MIVIDHVEPPKGVAMFGFFVIAQEVRLQIGFTKFQGTVFVVYQVEPSYRDDLDANFVCVCETNEWAEKVSKALNQVNA